MIHAWICIALIPVVIALGCSPPEATQPTQPDGVTASQDDPTPEPRRDVKWLPPEPSLLHEIDENDQGGRIVTQYADMVRQRHEPIGIECNEVKGAAVNRLFPEYRFFLCDWHDRSAYTTDALALDKDFKLSSIGDGLRYDKSFGEFLAEHKVRITDEKSARLVWDAYCEVMRWFTKTDTIEKVSHRL